MAAKTRILTGDALTNKAWGQDLYMDTLHSTYFGQFMGEGPNNAIRLQTELNKGKGDTVTIPYVGLLSGLGFTEGETAYGNEEKMTFYNSSVTINELFNAVEIPGDGTIDPQRVPFKFRKAAKELLQLWFQERYDEFMFRHLCGFSVSPAASTKLTGFNTPVAPSNQVWAGSHTTDETMASGDEFSFAAIDKALLKAKFPGSGSPKLRPIVMNGQKYYLCFIHGDQTYDLQTSTATGNWFDVWSKALQGGQYKDNPLFTGALGMYKNVILHESDYITNGVNSTTSAEVTTCKRAVLVGANAAAVAFGDQYGDQQFSWAEELKDYKRTLGVGGGIVMGVNIIRFNSKDNGRVVISSYDSHGN